MYVESSEASHVVPLDLCSITEPVVARPAVTCTNEELSEVIEKVNIAGKTGDYIPQTPTVENPALSDDYIFDTADQNLILEQLNSTNFVGKVVDKSKGAVKRQAKGYPAEYLYIFKYPCRLKRRDALSSGVPTDDVLIYIKINNRKIPYERLIVVSFHKNHPKS